MTSEQLVAVLTAIAHPLRLRIIAELDGGRVHVLAVFSIFATMPLIDLKILGIGTAAAILIDATVVRGVLLPAALALLGDRAWGARQRVAAAVTASPSRGPRRRPGTGW